MNDLIAKLEAATEGSRELDKKIAFAVQWRPQNRESKQSFEEHERKHDYTTAWIAHAPWHSDWDIPHYTTSLDAAMTTFPLNPENREISIKMEHNESGIMDYIPGPFCLVKVYYWGWGPSVEVRRPNCPKDRSKALSLALCIASCKVRTALKARQE